MGIENALELTFEGNALGESLDDFGALRPSSDALDDREELRRRMSEDGYLYFAGPVEQGRGADSPAGGDGPVDESRSA